MNIPPTIRSTIEKANIAFEVDSWEEAFKLYKEVEGNVNSGHVAFRLGVMYQYGYFVKKDVDLASQYFKKALDTLLLFSEEDPESACDLGYMHDFGFGVDMDKIIAVKYYKQAADKGFPRAQSNLGYMYEKGEGVDENKSMAVTFYKLAADQGSPTAQCNLGYMYRNGHGVDEDMSLAMKYYELAAIQDYPRALCNLGHMYHKGYGTEMNKNIALKYYHQAAERGNRIAMYNLGDMYQYNKDLENKSFAVKYYILSAQKDYIEASKELKKIFRGEKEKTVLLGDNNKNSGIPEFRNIAVDYLAGEWPQFHWMLNLLCQKSLVEFFYIFCYVEDFVSIPVELIFLVARWMILVWPQPHYDC